MPEASSLAEPRRLVYGRSWPGVVSPVLYPGIHPRVYCDSPSPPEVMNSRVTKVLAPWLNFIVQLALSQPPLMVLKAEMQSQETEPSNFYSSPLIQAEEDIQSGKFEAFPSHHSV